MWREPIIGLDGAKGSRRIASWTRCSSGWTRSPRELRALNRRLDSGDNLAPLVHELRALRESLQTLAYAALGQQGPQVRRRRSG